MAFTQDLFSSRRNQDDGNTRIGETDRIWYDSNRNGFYISDGVTPGGILIGTGGGNGNVIITGGNYSNVNVDAWFSANIFNSLYSNVNLAAYLSSVTFGGNLDLGNLYITDETIGGKIVDRDITLLPAGTGLVSVPGLKVPVGSLVQGVSNITAVITQSTINNVERSSTGPADNLSTGDYGLTNGIPGTAPGWNVFQLYGNIVIGNTIQVGDTIVGAGLPFPSQVLFVGAAADTANANVVITTNTLNSLPPLAANTLVFTTRTVVNAGFAITTSGNTDITLNPGIGGNIVPAGSIIPLVSGVYNLGTPTRRFKELWLGAGTIYVQDETLGVDQAIGARDGNLYIAGGSGFTVGKFTLVGNTIALLSSTEDFAIGTQYATGNLIIRRPMQVINSANDIGFQVDRDGLTQIKSPVGLGVTRSVFSIVGTTSGNIQPRNFANTMVQITGNDNQPTRISFDAFGVLAGQNAYTAVASRAARGTVDTPTTTQAGDTIMRFTAQGWTGNGLYAGSILRMNFEAAETFTSNLKTGTRLTIATTPVGSNLIQTTAAFYSNGLSLFGNTQTGITFTDGSFQNTAFYSSDRVRKITTGVGFQNPGSYQGNVTLDTIDVHTLISDSYTLLAQNPGSNQNITLSLTQELSPNSSPTFTNLTVSNLTVNGTFTTVINASINGKILYLANNSTSASQIDGGGIILGNIAQGYYRSILYDLNNDRWDTNGAGLKTLRLVAEDTDVIGNLRVNTSAHFGTTAQTIDFPNATIQIDENINSYAQVVAMNHSPGTNASTDIVAVNNIGDDTVNYIDMGINSSTYTGAALGWTVSGANAGYLVVYGNSALPPNGNLTLGTATANTHIDFHTSGTTLNQIRASITDSGFTTPLPITSTVSTGTAPLVIASTTLVNNLYAARAVQADSLNPGATINGVQFFGNSAITIGSNASLLTGTYLNSTVIGSSLQTVGNLINLTVTGNANVGGNVSGKFILGTSHGIFNGNVYTNYFVGSGRYLTELPGYAYGNVNVKAYTETMGFQNYGNVNVYAYLNANYYLTSNVANLANYAWNANVTTANTIQSNQLTAINTAVSLANTIQSNQINLINATLANAYSNVNTLSYLTVNGYINNIQPRTLTSNVHIAANVVGNTATIITDATTANVANTIVVRDSTGTINVSGWTVGTRLTAVDYTATNSDYWIGTTVKNLTITLPNAASGAANGRQYQVADTVHTGNPGTTIAAQSPATATGNQPSQQGQIIICTYVNGVWYLN